LIDLALALASTAKKKRKQTKIIKSNTNEIKNVLVSD